MSSPPPHGSPPPETPLQAVAAPVLRALPWEDRAVLGPVPAAVQTVELFVLRPREGFLRARRRGDVLSPTLWVLLVALVGELAQLFWAVAIGHPLQALLDGDRSLSRVLFTAEASVFPVVFGPISAAAGVFVVAGILHAGLALLGGLERSQLGYDGSLRAVSYAYTAQLALVLPVVGRPIAFLWMLPLAALGLEALHDTTFGRALAAVVIPLLVCCLCGLLVSALFGAAVAGLLARLG